jgi:hypothetical protein
MIAQASLEYLVLSLISLSLVSISILALVSVKEGSANIVDSFSFRSSVMRLKNAISEVCALGSGNGRAVRLGSPISVESDSATDGYIIRFKKGDYSIVSGSRCAVLPGRINLEGEIFVENVGGSVALRER